MTDNRTVVVATAMLAISCTLAAGCGDNLQNGTQEVAHMKIGEIIGTAQARNVTCFTGHPVIRIYEKNRIDELDPYRPLECLKYEDIEQMLLNAASGFDTYFTVSFDSSARVSMTASFDLIRHDVVFSDADKSAIHLRPGLMRFTKTQGGWQELSVNQAASDGLSEYVLSVWQGKPQTPKFCRIERKRATASRWRYDDNGKAVGVQPIAD